MSNVTPLVGAGADSVTVKEARVIPALPSASVTSLILRLGGALAAVTVPLTGTTVVAPPPANVMLAEYVPVVRPDTRLTEKAVAANDELA